MQLTLSACSVCRRCPDNKANNVTTLSVRSFRLSLSAGCIFPRYSSTAAMSHVAVYLGREGRFSKTPFMNLRTKGWVPNGKLSGKITYDESALRAVLRAL